MAQYSIGYDNLAGKYNADALAAMNKPEPADRFTVAFVRGLQRGIWHGPAKFMSPKEKDLNERDYQGQGIWMPGPNGGFKTFASLEADRIASDIKRKEYWEQVADYHQVRHNELRLTAGGRAANKVGYFLGLNSHEAAALMILPVGNIAYKGARTTAWLASKGLQKAVPRFIQAPVKQAAKSVGTKLNHIYNKIMPDWGKNAVKKSIAGVGESVSEATVIETLNSNQEGRSFDTSNIVINTVVDRFGMLSLKKLKTGVQRIANIEFPPPVTLSRSGSAQSVPDLANMETVLMKLKKHMPAKLLEEAYGLMYGAAANAVLDEAGLNENKAKIRVRGH